MESGESVASPTADSGGISLAGWSCVLPMEKRRYGDEGQRVLDVQSAVDDLVGYAMEAEGTERSADPWRRWETVKRSPTSWDTKKCHGGRCSTTSSAL